MHTNECNKVCIIICNHMYMYMSSSSGVYSANKHYFKPVMWYIDYDLVKSIPFVNPVGKLAEKHDDFLCYQGHDF